MNRSRSLWRGWSGAAAWLALAAAILVHSLEAQPPGWWQRRGVTDPLKPHDDYGVANVGQIKNIATQAGAELDAVLIDGAQDEIESILANFWDTSSDDFSIVNLGQLKGLGKPFYDRLIQNGFATAYPWSAAPGSADDYSGVNIGQVKNLFNFDPRTSFPADLAGYWNFNSTNPDIVDDGSTHVRDGVLHDALRGEGLFGGGVILNGVDSYVEIPGTSGLSVGNGITLSALVYLDAEAASLNQWMRIVSTKQDWNLPAGFEIEYNPAGGFPSINLPHGRLTFGGRGMEQLIAYGVDLMDGWHHVCAVAQPIASTTTYAAALYVDGILQTQAKIYSAGGFNPPTLYPAPKPQQVFDQLLSNTAPVTIGRHAQPVAGANYFMGSIDEVKVFERALTPVEIRHLIPDSDDDLMPDWWEKLNNLDYLNPADAFLDPDSDRLSNRQEWFLRTDPHFANDSKGAKDSDGDGIPDTWEVIFGLNPLDAADGMADPDFDGVANLYEFALDTDPHDSDSDDNSTSDGSEDRDRDLLPDAWELAFGLNIREKDDQVDGDGDDATNLAEFQRGSNPNDYYDGVLPIITRVSADLVDADPGAFGAEPFSVSLTKENGSLLANAPVKFKVISGDAKVAADGQDDPKLLLEIDLVTNEVGVATAFISYPSNGGDSSVIRASASTSVQSAILDVTATALSTVATPTASPAGPIVSTQTVTLQCATTGAAIYYTLSGVEPTEQDLFVSPGQTVQVDPGDVLVIKATKAGSKDSLPNSIQY